MVRPDALDLVVHVVAGHGVERTKRLVHEHDLGVLRQHAGQRDALPHTSGKLVRALVCHSAEPDSLEQFVALSCTVGARDAVKPQCQLDVARAVSQGSRVASWNMKRPCRRPQSCRSVGCSRPATIEQRALAAARGADDGHELAGSDVEIDVVERNGADVVLAENLGDPLDSQCGGAAPSSRDRPPLSLIDS